MNDDDFRVLTMATATFKSTSNDEEQMQLICIVANQSHKRNPFSIIVRLDQPKDGQEPPKLVKSGEGLVYREFEQYKRLHGRYGWEIVLHSGAKDDVRTKYNFNAIADQTQVFTHLKAIMDEWTIVEYFKLMEMPFNPIVLGVKNYEAFGAWS
ncbi:hypothetical protein ACNAUY_07760 [Acinetobacter tibetensis]|uniref:hypothetical protein n=1 Tax=Acinetobacter tibetensis TaxID=2943497 RepID=UPI003A4D6DD9